MITCTCTKCRQEKELNLENFPPHNKKKNGFDSWCRECRSSYRSGIRRGNYRMAISDEHLKTILSTTNDCVICGYVFENKSEKIVDHDHKSGRIRGILCNHCNRGLGHFRDDPMIMEFGRIYLLEAQGDEEAEEYVSKYFVKEC